MRIHGQAGHRGVKPVFTLNSVDTLTALRMPEEIWKEVWERKGRNARIGDSYTVAELFAADGFDGALGLKSEAGRTHMGDRIRELLGIGAGDRILEVGCGAGAALFLLQASGASLSGVDYSAPHVEIARSVMPRGDFRVAEAAALPFADASFDRVFSNGVFLYFDNLAYAAAALGEMVRVCVPGAPILLLDLPDAATKDACIEARRNAGASLTPPHLYFPRDFFESFARRHGREALFTEQVVPDYGNAAFRYNVLLTAAAGV